MFRLMLKFILFAAISSVFLLFLTSCNNDTAGQVTAPPSVTASSPITTANTTETVQPTQAQSEPNASDDEPTQVPDTEQPVDDPPTQAPETEQPVDDTPAQAPETEQPVDNEPTQVPEPEQPVDNEPTQAPEPETEQTSAPIISNGSSSPALLAETSDMGQAYIDSIIFLGDSTTYGLKYYEVLSGGEDTNQVWTPASGTLTLSNQSFATIVFPPSGEEIEIRSAVARELPAMMVITLGVNGVSFMDKDYFKSEYSALVNDIKDISPDTRIILQSIFPIAENYEYQADINNYVISEANGWILEIAEETGVKYLDTISVLMGSDGFLPQEYQNGDGIHLNYESFSIVIDYIRTHGYQ